MCAIVGAVQHSTECITALYRDIEWVGGHCERPWCHRSLGQVTATSHMLRDTEDVENPSSPPSPPSHGHRLPKNQTRKIILVLLSDSAPGGQQRVVNAYKRHLPNVRGTVRSDFRNIKLEALEEVTMLKLRALHYSSGIDSAQSTWMLSSFPSTILPPGGDTILREHPADGVMTIPWLARNSARARRKLLFVVLDIACVGIRSYPRRISSTVLATMTTITPTICEVFRPTVFNEWWKH